MIRSSGGPDTPQRNRNNIPDPLRAIALKIPVEDGSTLTELIISRVSSI